MIWISHHMIHWSHQLMMMMVMMIMMMIPVGTCGHWFALGACK